MLEPSGQHVLDSRANGRGFASVVREDDEEKQFWPQRMGFKSETQRNQLFQNKLTPQTEVQHIYVNKNQHLATLDIQ